MGINFPTRSEIKISPTKAVTSPRHFFVDREVKKIKDSGDKIAHRSYNTLKLYYYKSKIIKLIQIMSKIK